MENGFMLFEMPLLLGEGSARRDKMGGQFLFGVRCFGYQTPAGIQLGSEAEFRRDSCWI